MPSAEIITIGTELLLGEIQDTNTRYLAKKLKDVNIDLFRTTTVGDNAVRIASLIQEALTRSDIIITTGGLGPTIDDPTRDAVALAFNTQTDYHPELWSEIEQRFLKRSLVPTENNRRQAFLPRGSEAIHNPVGTAPAFFVATGQKIVISLPGVPREMEFLIETSVIPLLKQKYQLQGIIKARVIHLAGIGESVVDSIIGDFEKLSNPTVGLLAHPGIVDIRITAKADSISEANQMIAEVEQKISPLFPNKIYGFDEDTLANSLISLAKSKQLLLRITSFGLERNWPPELLAKGQKTILVKNLASPQTKFQNHFLAKTEYDVQADCKFVQFEGENRLESVLFTAKKEFHFSNLYNGPGAQGANWAVNAFLETLRQTLLNLD